MAARLHKILIFIFVSDIIAAFSFNNTYQSVCTVGTYDAQFDLLMRLLSIVNRMTSQLVDVISSLMNFKHIPEKAALVNLPSSVTATSAQRICSVALPLVVERQVLSNSAARRKSTARGGLGVCLAIFA